MHRNIPMKTLWILIIMLIANSTLAQTTYYKLQTGEILTQENYNELKKKNLKISIIHETLLFTETKGDSIIKNIRLMNILNTYDPYANLREYVGLKFPIEKFKKPDGTFYTINSLKGKPTLINFWFANCPPCIKEIPLLNRLKKEMGDSVNFIAITFEKNRVVKHFLNKTDFNFVHIVDAKLQLDYFNIHSYPVNMILDKEGTITHVFGMFIFKNDIKKILQQLLSDQ